MKIIESSLDIKPYKSRIWDSYFAGLKTGVFDIETTGLNPLFSKVILGGLADYTKGGVCRQFFADESEDEAELLRAYTEAISSYDVLISYNGEFFDLPFLKERLKKKDIEYDLDAHWSFDLYRAVHKHSGLRQILPNLKQKTLEKFLGIAPHRDDEISGGESVLLYKEYLRNKDPALAEKILLHNKDDLVQLSHLTKILEKLDLHKIMFHEGFAESRGKARIIVKEIKFKKGQLEIQGLGTNIPSDFYSFKASHHAVYKDKKLFLTIPFEQVKNAEIFDLMIFSGDFASLENLPGYEKGYLIARENGEVNYGEVNSLVKIILQEVLREFAGQPPNLLP